MHGRVFLTGFMGCGKSTTGRLLAERLERTFVDLDDWIMEEAGLEIPAIFESLGESVFRQLESLALERTLSLSEAVIATGGGTMTLERNRDFVHRHGVSVWINTPFQLLTERLGDQERSDRPLFRDATHAFELFRERLPAYQQADLQIDVGSDDDAAEIAARIVLLLGERVCSF